MRIVIILLSTLLFKTSAVWSQRECGTIDNNESVLLKYPELSERIGKVNKAIVLEPFDLAPTTIIPVVVHIVYKNDAEKLSAERIHSQIRILNEDFSGINRDNNKVPPFFALVQAGDCKIRFQLDSIIWKKTTVPKFIITPSSPETVESDSQIKFDKLGGSNSVSSTNRLNIWVGDIYRKDKYGPVITLGGYSTFPGGINNIDGVVINYKYFGDSGSQTPYHKGRTATHEIGHWLDLHHIWGDTTCGDDGISDTPVQEGKTKGCPDQPLLSCQNAPNGAMFMNYMDYSNDECMFMFTREQKKRMLNTLKKVRKGFIPAWAPQSSFKFFNGERQSFHQVPIILNVESGKAETQVQWTGDRRATQYQLWYKEVKAESWNKITTTQLSATFALPVDSLYEVKVFTIFSKDIRLESEPYVFISGQ